MSAERPILVVCTGNICRSAYLHHCLGSELTRRLGDQALRIESRGTRVNPSLSPPSELRALVPDELAWRLAEHVPVQLQASDVMNASVVLAASQEHLDEVLREVPGAMKQAFTVAEFAAAAEAAQGRAGLPDIPGERLQALVLSVARQRSRIRSEISSLSIPDPYGHGHEAYRSMVSEVSRYAEQLADFIAPRTDRVPDDFSPKHRQPESGR